MARLDAFLKDFVQEVKEKHSERIEFIILAGSASRGDFKVGKSDLDLGIRVKSQKHIGIVKKEAEEIFWRLDKKHSMEFGKALKAHKEDSLFIHGKKMKEPFHVHGPDYDPRKDSLFWKLNFIHGFNKTMMIQTLRYGNILYGSDSYLAELAQKKKCLRYPWDYFFTYHLFLSLAVLPLFIISPDYALRRSIKSVYFTHFGKDEAGMARTAVFARYNFETVKMGWSYPRKGLFCLKAPFHIARYNMDLLRSSKDGISAGGGC